MGRERKKSAVEYKESDKGLLKLYLSFNGNPYSDLEFDKNMMRDAEMGRVGLFVYTWPRPVFVLGYSQASDSVLEKACATEGIPMLRRVTGGTGVLRDMDLGISLALPSIHPWARNVSSSYVGFVGSVAETLEQSGIDADQIRDVKYTDRDRSPICYENKFQDSLLMNGKKIFGCAQARKKGAVLIHGALLLGLNAGLQSRVFGVPPERIEAAMAHVLLPSGNRGFAEVLAEKVAARLDTIPRSIKVKEMEDGTRSHLRSQYGTFSDSEQGWSHRFGYSTSPHGRADSGNVQENDVGTPFRRKSAQVATTG